MSRIQPISTTRTTDALTRQRLTNQIQGDQLDLFRLQNQLSTGYRIFLPSDDAPAAQRAMALQRTIERKEQSATNLQGANSALSATDASLASVSDSLYSLRADALGVVDTVASDQQRQGVIDAIDALLNELVQIGNSRFTGTYLLGGGERASQSYQATGQYFEYYGDESSPQTFVDIGLLFDAGVAGDEVLGGLSEAVRGTVDLNPELTPDTRLSDLNGGLGVSPNGSISLLFDPTDVNESGSTSLVDLSRARTVADVARLIETGAPEGAEVTVHVDGDGLRIDTSNGGLTISEVGEGDTALELGIRTTNVPAATITGTDLDPAARLTDRLDDLVGSKARGRVELVGSNNDIVLAAAANDATLNGVNVVLQAGAAAGAEAATYSAGTLTVTIAEGESRASDVIAAINAEGTFVAEADYRDESAVGAAGGGIVAGAVTVNSVTAGGVDGSIDLASGVQVTNGAETYVIDTSAAETFEDLLNLFNDPQYGLDATLNADRTGIDIRTRRSGADFAIGENGGSTATDLGVRTYTESSQLADFNRGVGVIVVPGEELGSPPRTQAETDAAIRAQNTLTVQLREQGTTYTYEIDPIGLSTVQDIIDAVGGVVSEPAGGPSLTATLNVTGNGLTITRADAVDPITPAEATFSLPGVPGDTLTLTAINPGPVGNDRDFTFTVVDTGAGGLSTSRVDDAITIDLGGATPDTANIAAAIQGEFTGFTVASDGTAAGVTTGSVAATSGGGFLADELTISGTMAERLGFLPEGQSSVTTTTGSVSSTDTKPLEVDSVFTTLTRMRDALEANDTEAIGREIERLDDDLDRVNFARAEIGVRLRTLESIGERLADEEVQLRDALSQEIDADLVEVISDYTAKQASLQASLQTSASLLSLSILDFL